jgi:hypothetical protein
VRACGLAVLVLAGACGGGSHRSSATGQLGPGSSGVTSTTSGAGAGAAAAGTTGAPTTGGSKATAAPAKSASSNTAATAGAGARASTASAAGAAPGHYTYDVTGSRSGGTPPTTAPINGKATLTVDPALATDQHETLVSDDGSGNGTELVLRYQPDGVFLVDLKITGQFAKEFRPNPPVLAEPVPQTQGKHWQWDLTSTDNTTTAHGDYTMGGPDTTSNGCKPVACGVVNGTLTIHTTFNGAPFTIALTTNRVDSPKYSVTVKEHDVTDVPGFFHSDTTSVIESVVPK